MTLRFLRLLGAFVALNLATAACTDSQTPEPTESESSSLDAQAGPTVVRVFIDDPSDVFDLSDFDVLEFRDRSRGFVLVLTQPEEFDSLVAVGYPVEIDAARTESIRRPPANFASPLNVGIPGFPCYRTVEESYARAEELTLDYPHLASWSDVGDSWSKIAGGPGYDLFVLRLTNKNIPGDKPVLFATSSIHAREYTPAELSLRFAETLVEGYGTQPDATWLLDHHEVHLMIQANPDGRKEAEQGALWRKNTNQDHCVWRSSRGVDLNRNFSFEWSCCGGSSGRSCNSTFRGPSAASEPETVAVQDYASSVFADQRGPNIEDAAPIDAQGLYIDIHSFSELILWPWGFSGEAPNGGGLRRLGEKISYFNGYAPSQAVELYPTDGTTVDFVYGELGVASIVFELGTQFFQSCEVFEQQILPDNLQALVYAAKTAAAPYLVPGGPDLSEVSWNGSSLTAFASSERRGSGLPIARVEASWSLPPIGASAPDGFELDPMDGAFDSSEEEVGLALTTVQPGRRLLYLRAQDGEGRFGAPSAVFVDGGGPTGSLDGQVTSASDGTPLTAMLSVEELGLRVSTDGTGAFQMALPEGTWTVTVSIGGMSRAYPALEILEGQTTLMNFVF